MKPPLSTAWPARVFLVVLAIACWAMTVHLGKPLLGPHSFRQTQTAISSYYMAQDASLFADYITPVLGKPWRIPMELPVYQWLVARWHNLSGMALDPSGKLVSVAAWLACMVSSWVLLRSLRFDRSQILIALVLLLTSPLYLFWSNAFLIESTGVFFALSMVACALRGHEMKSAPWLATGLLFGVLAILCKASTWAVAAGSGGLLLVLRHGWPQWRMLFGRSKQTAEGETPGLLDAVVLIAALFCLLLPIIAGKLWLSYGDSIKAANPFGRYMRLGSSSNFSKWNYGTWEQKLDPATWQVIWRHITDQLLVPFPLIGPFLMPLILLVGAIAMPRRIPLMLVFLIGFAAGPMVFTNLYFEHNYYWYANGIWLLLAVGTALAGISEFRPGKFWPQFTALVLAALMAISGFTVWFRRYLPILTSLPQREQINEVWIKPVQAVVPLGRTLFIVGHDWNPAAHYYAERMGLAQPSAKEIRFPGPEFEESIKLLGPDDRPGAMVISDALLTQQNQPTIAKILQQLGMSLNGQRTAYGVMFPAEDLKSASPSE